MTKERPSGSPGFTPRAIVVALLTMLLSAMFIQIAGVTDRWSPNLGAEPISAAALIPVLIVLCVGAVMFAFTRLRLLTRAEMVVVMFATMIATPLMSHGLWRHMLASASTVARGSMFDKLDDMSPRLWLHGRNVLNGVLVAKDAMVSSVGDVEWLETEVKPGTPAVVAALSVDSAGGRSLLTIRMPIDSLKRGVPHILTVLARARDLGPQSRYFCRLWHDSLGRFDEEVFSSRQEERPTYSQPSGFVRQGKYGVVLSRDANRFVDIEFGLEGSGTVELYDVQLMDVEAIEDAFGGRHIIDQDDFERLAPVDRAGLIVRPRRMLSIEGLKFLMTGYFPVREWLGPMAAWGGFVALLLTVTFVISVIMRRQWVQYERFPMPVAQVPFALLEDPGEKRFLAPVLRNRLMWLGFGITLVWCLLRIARGFNNALPNLAVNLPLSPYFTDPAWGSTWNDVSFAVYGLFFGIGLFMELNVLLSLVAGFFLYRFQYWFGETYGLKGLAGYPFAEVQLLGAYVAYALLTLVFARKYLWRVLKMAVKGERDGEEAMSYRSALLVLVASLVGVVLWSKWVGLAPAGMLAFFALMVTVGFVTAKLRAECGPGSMASAFGPALAFFVAAMGGVQFFGGPGTIFISMAGAVFGYYLCVFNAVGMELELLEAGRRTGLRRRHMAYAAAMGVAGGVLVGGWVYLSSLYSVGADNYPLKSAHFEGGSAMFEAYTKSVAAATEEMTPRQDQPVGAATRIDPTVLAALFAGTATAVVTLLRQLFAGFWFHPVGFIAGPTTIMIAAWGSLLLAWFVRFMVLRLGGAATVREKLLPFATGVVLAVMVAYAFAFAVNGFVFFFSPGGKFFFAEFL